ncbi:E3 SUMO-protein ligase ZBED1-like [Mugil cephalus]|uniref:E3 SUMO-protein ligase ZBED1-like n=1 Tax=Mugil cephalus TaxID=48193 RepID=UPI001FB7F3F1|nr:E3 SUMO-protein ligase ZBED1-like [Mugil cephalus]
MNALSPVLLATCCFWPSVVAGTPAWSGNGSCGLSAADCWILPPWSLSIDTSTNTGSSGQTIHRPSNHRRLDAVASPGLASSHLLAGRTICGPLDTARTASQLSRSDLLPCCGLVMGRATLVHQHCAESSRGKPRIGACIALRKNHVTDTGTVSFGCAAPKCVYKETNCINMSWVCRMEFCLIMDRPRKFTPVWNNFDLVTPNKVKCRLCSTELSYINKSTSSMLRHYRARHGNEELADTRESTPVPNKQAVDEAVVNMIIKDCQPLSFVENEGFRELLKLIVPLYALPSRKTIKDLVSQRYEEEKEKTKKDLQSAVAVTLTADMWTSMNMEAYLAVTGHYMDKESHELHSSVLAVQHFPQKHTAENIATVKRSLMEEWGIAGKVRCLVTDAAANMTACARMLQIRHTICIAHSLNIIVRKSCDQIPTITEIRNKTRHIVTYFRSSVTAKELNSWEHRAIN